MLIESKGFGDIKVFGYIKILAKLLVFIYV